MSQKGYTTNKRYPSVSSFFFFSCLAESRRLPSSSYSSSADGVDQGGEEGKQFRIGSNKAPPRKIIYKLILVGVPAMLSLVHIVSSSENRVCRCSVPRGVYISHFIPPRVSCHRRLDVPKGKKKRKRIQHKGVCLVIVSHIMRITIIIIPQMPLCHVV